MNDTALQNKEYYERYWSAGKQVFSGSKQGYAGAFRRWMATQLGGMIKESTVLEVGCGDATFTSELARYSSAVTAIDISAGQIAENAARLPDIAFRQHDVAVRLPFEDRSFAVVWCSEVLEHLFDPGFALHEMLRVLRPGGQLLVTVPYHGRFKNLLIALFKWDQHFVPSNPHIRFFTKRTMARLG
ncbi:MAG: class I SAM-dependent methyltransferase, partial [Gemmatimonadaceae bacterium]